MKIMVLGVFLGPGNFDDDNWKPRIAAVGSTLSSWRQHILSFQGRALVINALALSRVWYVASLIHIPLLDLGELLRLVFSFFWKGKKDLVARTVVVQAPSAYGFSVVDVNLCWFSGSDGLSRRNPTGLPLCASGFTLSLTPLRWRCCFGPLLLAPVLSLRFISRYCWPGALLMVYSVGRGRPW